MSQLPEYTSLQEKQNYFAEETDELPWVINTQDEFDKLYDILIKKDVENIESGRKGIFYRGINEAKYQTFTSAQRHWLCNDWEDNSRNGFVRYIATELWNIRKNSQLSNYYKSLGVHPNDLLFLAFLQHYEGASPLLDLTNNLNTGLFFAFDKMVTCKCRNNEIDNYVSLQILDYSIYGSGHFVNMIEYLESGIEKACLSIDDWEEKHPGQDINDSLLRDIAKLTAWYNPYNPGGSLSDIGISLLDLNNDKLVMDLTGRLLYWSNLRLISQQGAFLFYTDHERPLEKYLIDIEAPRLRCININKSLNEYISNKINKDRSSIYPSEIDIARDANSRAISALQRK